MKHKYDMPTYCRDWLETIASHKMTGNNLRFCLIDLWRFLEDLSEQTVPKTAKTRAKAPAKPAKGNGAKSGSRQPTKLSSASKGSKTSPRA